MLAGLTWLLIFQCIGEGISYVFSLPIPGPVLGMLFLFLTLQIKDKLPDTWREAGHGILSHLSLLFIPAGVGVMLHWRQIANEWLAISIALIVSTTLAIISTALTIQYFINRKIKHHK